MVRNDMALMADLSRRFREFCAGHGVDSANVTGDLSANVACPKMNMDMTMPPKRRMHV